MRPKAKRLKQHTPVVYRIRVVYETIRIACDRNGLLTGVDGCARNVTVRIKRNGCETGTTRVNECNDLGVVGPTPCTVRNG